jgi:hypothetical protein
MEPGHRSLRITPLSAGEFREFFEHLECLVRKLRSTRFTSCLVEFSGIKFNRIKPNGEKRNAAILA